MITVKLRRADGKPFFGRKRVLTVDFQAPGFLARKYRKQCPEWSDIDDDESAGRWTLEYTNMEACVDITFDFVMGDVWDDEAGRTFEPIEASYWEDIDDGIDGDTTITEVTDFTAEVIYK